MRSSRCRVFDRRKLAALKDSKEGVEKRLLEVMEQKKSSMEMISTWLSKNSSLIFECDSLSAATRACNAEFEELKLTLTKLKCEHQAMMEVEVIEKDAIEVELLDVKAVLVVRATIILVMQQPSC